jgi:hypothetical protein
VPLKFRKNWASKRTLSLRLSPISRPCCAAEPDPRDLMRPFPADLMRMRPISTRVNKPENDDHSIV